MERPWWGFVIATQWWWRVWARGGGEVGGIGVGGVGLVEVEQGFRKVVRQAGFFTKDLDLGLFDPFKDVKDDVLLEEEDLSTEEEQDIEEQGDEANVWVSFCLFSSFLGFWWK